MAANYPTYNPNEYNTNTGMNRVGYGTGGSYSNLQGPTASNQARSTPWNANDWGGGTQPGYSQYASGQARGGGQPYQRPAPTSAPTYQQGEPSIRESGTGPYNPNGGPQNYPTSGGYQPTPYQPPPAWTPYQPTTQPLNQGQPQTVTPWNAGVPTTPAGWNTQALRDQYGQYLSAMLPYQQYQQNQMQYANDFNEAQRRWNEQFGWTQQGDRFNQDLSTRQQQMAEWQAQEAARQWNDQFGWQRETDLFSQDLANRQLGQQAALQREQMAIEQAYNQGRLTNEQRQLALQELQAGQDEAFRRDQLAQQLGFSREELASRDALARWQTAQQLEAQRQAAILQATGRNQAPSVKWMRRA